MGRDEQESLSGGSGRKQSRKKPSDVERPDPPLVPPGVGVPFVGKKKKDEDFVDKIGTVFISSKATPTRSKK